jgi:hypothetical protein
MFTVQLQSARSYFEKLTCVFFNSVAKGCDFLGTSCHILASQFGHFAVSPSKLIKFKGQKVERGKNNFNTLALNLTCCPLI